eukprot:1338511-Amphidinium_carterae.1
MRFSESGGKGPLRLTVLHPAWTSPMRRLNGFHTAFATVIDGLRVLHEALELADSLSSCGLRRLEVSTPYQRDLEVSSPHFLLPRTVVAVSCSVQLVA